MADKPGSKDVLSDQPGLIKVVAHDEPGSVHQDAYAYPQGTGDRDKLMQRYQELTDRAQQLVTPEMQSQLQEQVLKPTAEILSKLPKDQADVVQQKLMQLAAATSVEQYHQLERDMVNAVTDPNLKQQLQGVFDRRDKILGPELIDTFCQGSAIYNQLATMASPAQSSMHGQEGGQPADGAKTLARMEQDYDSHIDKLLKGEKKTIREVGHAVLEGNLPALERLLKGNDTKVAAIVNDVNQGLEYVHSSMSLATTPGHVLLQSAGSDKAIDIDTKKHISVEHSAQMRPDGSMSIDMSSIITGDTRKDARTMAEQSLFSPYGERNSWSVTGNARSYYGDGGARNYYNGRAQAAGTGQWRAPYGAAANVDAGGDNLLAQQSAAPSVGEKLMQLESAFQSASTPQDGLKANDAAFQTLLKEADDNFQKKYAQKEGLEKQLESAFPPEKKQQFLDAMEKLSADIAKLPADQQQEAVTAMTLGDSQFLLKHPVLMEDINKTATFMKEMAPAYQSMLEIDAAANEKMEVGMFYAKDLAKAGDPRAKDVLSQTYDSLPVSLKKQYAKNPDFQSIASSVGLFIPDDSQPKRRSDQIAI